MKIKNLLFVLVCFYGVVSCTTLSSDMPHGSLYDEPYGRPYDYRSSVFDSEGRRFDVWGQGKDPWISDAERISQRIRLESRKFKKK